jgi:hypothetical protein
MQNTCRCCLLNDDNQILLDMIQNEILFESSDNRVSASFMEVSFFFVKISEQNVTSNYIFYRPTKNALAWKKKKSPLYRQQISKFASLVLFN